MNLNRYQRFGQIAHSPFAIMIDKLVRLLARDDDIQTMRCISPSKLGHLNAGSCALSRHCVRLSNTLRALFKAIPSDRVLHKAEKKRETKRNGGFQSNTYLPSSFDILILLIEEHAKIKIPDFHLFETSFQWTVLNEGRVAK